MVYLININHGGHNVVAARCATEEGAKIISRAFKERGVAVYRVGWLAYWLQKHNFTHLASVIATLQNP